MANLRDLTRSSFNASTGLPGGDLQGRIKDALLEPFTEVLMNLTPRAMFGNFAQASGIGEILPLLTGGLSSLGGTLGTGSSTGPNASLRDHEEHFYDQSNEFYDDFEATHDNIEDSTNTLAEIKKVLDKIYIALTTDSPWDIERRREGAASAPHNPFSPTGPTAEETSGGFLGGLGDKIASFLPAGLGGAMGGAMGGLAGGLGLKKLGGALLRGAKVFTRFLGPVGIVATALLSLEQEDWEKIGKDIDESFARITDGDWIGGTLMLGGVVLDALKDGTANMVGDLMGWAGWDEEGEAFKKYIKDIDLTAGARKLADNIKFAFDEEARLAAEHAERMKAQSEAATEAQAKIEELNQSLRQAESRAEQDRIMEEKKALEAEQGTSLNTEQGHFAREGGAINVFRNWWNGTSTATPINPETNTNNPDNALGNSDTGSDPSEGLVIDVTPRRRSNSDEDVIRRREMLKREFPNKTSPEIEQMLRQSIDSTGSIAPAPRQYTIPPQSSNRGGDAPVVYTDNRSYHTTTQGNSGSGGQSNAAVSTRPRSSIDDHVMGLVVTP